MYQRAFQKAGGGNSSGLGEFWNNELAYKAALAAFDAELLLLPLPVVEVLAVALERCTNPLKSRPPRLGFSPNNILSSSFALLSEDEAESSSSDKLNIPSLGERR